MGRHNRSRYRNNNRSHNHNNDHRDNMIYDKAYGQLPKSTNLTEAQKTVEALINLHDGTFVGGPAGTGKSHSATRAMIESLVTGKCTKAIITRPTVTAGEEMGYLPGDLKAKIDPFLRPIYDLMDEIAGHARAEALKANDAIEVLPIQFMRGTTFHNTFVLIDEAQNCTATELKLVLTRLGRESKFVVTYDPKQIDLQDLNGNTDYSGVNLIRKFKDAEDFGFYEFSEKDIVRSELVKKVLKVIDG